MIVFGGFRPPQSQASMGSDSWPEGFLTVEQAAVHLGISPQRVRVLLVHRKLQGFLLRRGFREVWAVHKSLRRRPAKPGRPRTRRRTAAAMNGGSAAKP
jgi:hypothetical protein